MKPMIDYGMLGTALAFYVNHGWRQVEVPWLISRETSLLTFASPEAILETQKGCLVGSAEQGFLEIDATDGRLMAVTPCFRDEKEDHLHQTYFLKLELHRQDDISDAALEDMIDTAERFMWGMLNRRPERAITADGIDLMCEGIELGSYGRRTAGDKTWLYGTGLALPRLSIAALESRLRAWNRLTYGDDNP